MDFANDFLVDDPLKFFYFLEGEFAVNIFRFGSHSCSLVSLSSVCLIFLKLYGWATEGIGSNFPCLLNFFSCVGAWLKYSVLVLFLFSFAWTSCPLFYCFVSVYPIHWHLNLFARDMALENFNLVFK